MDDTSLILNTENNLSIKKHLTVFKRLTTKF